MRAASPMQPMPLIVLGGSDRKPGELPASGAGLHPLAAYKGAAIRIGGRPLIRHLLARVRAADGFGPLAVAGPARIYAPLDLPARIIDTDGTVAQNLRAAIEHHQRTKSEPLAPVAILACDVLPSTEELASLRRVYEDAAPCALWFPLVRVPEDAAALGAFAWKPSYRFAPEEGGASLRILPGHLGILEPDALRLPLLYRLMDAAYRTRNRSIALRRSVMLREILFSLIARDLGLLASFKLPTLTVGVLSNGLRLARELRAGTLAIRDLEKLIDRIFHRKHGPARASAHGIRYPVTDFISLAQDIDTEEEAHAIAGAEIDES